MPRTPEWVYHKAAGLTGYNLCINMPKGKESCRYCPCVKYDNNSGLRKCNITSELLPYYDAIIGQQCPLEIIEEIDEEDAEC